MHYCVLVIADDVSEVENLMAPYNNYDETYFTTFTLYDMDQDVAKQRETYEKDFTHLYETFEDYAQDTYFRVPDSVTGQYGEWYNPEGRWDGWEFADTHGQMLPTKNGQTTHICRVKDLSFEPRRDWYHQAIRDWEVIKEKQPLRPDEIEEAFWFDIPAFYPDKESYARHCSEPASFASGVIMDGEWIECAPYYKPVTPEGTKECQEILQSLNPDKLVVVVHCYE